MPIVLDSDVVIDILKDRAGIAAWLRGLDASGETFVLPAPALAEVLRGTGRQGGERVRGLLANLDVLPFDTAAANRYGSLMASLDAAGRPIANVDGQIAAIALENGGRLATRNRRHFDRVLGLEVLVPGKT